MSDNHPEFSLLIVDDESFVLSFVQEAFKEYPYQVLTASNSKEALSVLEAVKIHAVLTDFQMPGGLNGMDLLKEIKQRWPEIMVIMITGSGGGQGSGGGHTTRGR